MYTLASLDQSLVSEMFYYLRQYPMHDWYPNTIGIPHSTGIMYTLVLDILKPSFVYEMFYYLRQYI